MNLGETLGIELFEKREIYVWCHSASRMPSKHCQTGVVSEDSDPEGS